jgi:UDP-glucuronate 4-epimerase
MAMEGCVAMKVLVTGGAGFIGSHLVDRLLSGSNEVVVVDSFDPVYDVGLKELNVAAHLSNPKYRLVSEDILADEAYQRLRLESQRLGGFDAIVHLAARAGVRPSIDDPAGYQRVNVEGTQRLLEFAREQGIRQFVFASSSSVYGANPRLPWREDDLAVLPVSPYASTKVSGELMGHVYSHLFGIRFIALRLFTVYGPRQRPDLAINRFVRAIGEGREIQLFGEGRSKRDYTYVGDIVSGMLAALAYQGSGWEVINLGSGKPIELRAMVREVEAAMDRAAFIRVLPEQLGDVEQTHACNEKAARLLGFRPRTTFGEGLREFIAWRDQTDLSLCR